MIPTKHFAERNPEVLKGPLTQVDDEPLYWPGSTYWLNDGRRFVYGQTTNDIEGSGVIIEIFKNALSHLDVKMPNKNDFGLYWGSDKNYGVDRFKYGFINVNGQICVCGGHDELVAAQNHTFKFYLLDEVYTLPVPTTDSSGWDKGLATANLFRSIRLSGSTLTRAVSLTSMKSGQYGWFQNRGLDVTNEGVRWIGPKY